MSAPFPVILKRMDGNPVTIISQEVASIDSLVNQSGRIIGAVIHMKTGKEYEVNVNPAEATSRLFPVWLLETWGYHVPLG